MPEIVVLDTHIWIWWLNNQFDCLTSKQIETISITKRVAVSAVSAVSCFEIAQLVKRGRLDLPLPVEEWLREALAPANIELLPLSPQIACRAVSLADIHKDPFDRIIISTALNYQAKLMSNDGCFIQYPELHGYLLHS